MERWVTAWSYAQRNTRYTRWEGQDGFRLTVPARFSGSAFRLKYSNRYNTGGIQVKCVRVYVLPETESFGVAAPVGDVLGGEMPAPAGEVPAAREAVSGVVGKGGGASALLDGFHLNWGQDLYSREVETDLRPETLIQIEMTFADRGNPLTGNTFDGYVAMVLQSVDVLTDGRATVLACFGDSLTHQGRWTSPLFDRLHTAFPGRLAAFELGINGNRLLLGSEQYGNTLGMSGIDRFEHDVLGLYGLTCVVLALGINDIGLPGNEHTALSEFPEYEQMKDAYTDMAKRLHRAEVRAMAAAITPCNWRGGHEKRREALRLKVNGWILNTPVFDGALDLSTPLSADGKSGLKECYDSGDGIHINRDGGLRIMQEITVQGGEGLWDFIN